MSLRQQQRLRQQLLHADRDADGRRQQPRGNGTSERAREADASSSNSRDGGDEDERRAELDAAPQPSRRPVFAAHLLMSDSENESDDAAGDASEGHGGSDGASPSRDDVAAPRSHASEAAQRSSQTGEGTHDVRERDSEQTGSAVATRSAGDRGKSKKETKRRTALRQEPAGDDAAGSAATTHATAGVASSQQPHQHYTLDASLAPLDALLRVSEKHLNADAELQRTFGAIAAAGRGRDGDADADDGAPAGGAGARGARATAARRRRGGAAAPGAIRSGHAAGVLVPPQRDWPVPPTKAAGGLSMCRLPSLLATESPFAPACFTYESGEDYQRAQAALEAAVATIDPNLLVSFLQRHPWQLDGLLLLSEMQRTMRQHEASANTLRSCLHCLQATWHPGFKPWVTPCRVAIDAHAVNRTLYTGLWRYMQHAGRSGCPRAAFETAKLLLQLAPTGPVADPLRVLLCIDYYALRAKQPRFVAALTGGSDDSAGDHSSTAPMLCVRGSDVPCVWLPNLAFARALALRTGDGASKGTCEPDTARQPHRTVSPDVHNGVVDALYRDATYRSYSASRMLVRALLTYPHVLLPLLTALGIKSTDVGFGAMFAGAAAHGDVDPAADADDGVRPTLPQDCRWATVYRSGLFAEPYAEYDQQTHSADASAHWTPALEKLVRILVARQALLWRSPARLGWLYSCAQLAIFAAEAAAAWSTDAPAGTSVDSGRLTGGVATAAVPASAAVAAPSTTPAADAMAVAFFGSGEQAAAEATTAAVVRHELFFGSEGAETPHAAVWHQALAHYSGAIESGSCMVLPV